MLTKIIAEDQIQQTKHLLKKAQFVTIVSHQSPDGDALGSTLAMADFLQQQGKHVQVIYPDSFPEYLNWMHGADKTLIFELQPKACEVFISKSDVILCLDFHQLKRSGPISELIAASPA